MNLPSKLRGFTKTQLTTHAAQEFNEVIAGSKPDLLNLLTNLYANIDEKQEKNTGDTAISEDEKSMAQSIVDAADNSAVETFEAPADEVLPEMMQATQNPMNQTVITAETVKVDNAEYQVWPERVEWLYNPITKCRYPATDLLRHRMDLFPCAAPKGKYEGK